MINSAVNSAVKCKGAFAVTPYGKKVIRFGIVSQNTFIESVTKTYFGSHNNVFFSRFNNF